MLRDYHSKFKLDAVVELVNFQSQSFGLGAVGEVDLLAVHCASLGRPVAVSQEFSLASDLHHCSSFEIIDNYTSQNAKIH